MSNWFGGDVDMSDETETRLRRSQMTDPKLVLPYILAGNAKVTLVSRKTGTRFTYKVSKPAPAVVGDAVRKPTDIRFVALLTAPDNERGFTYMGQIYPQDMNYSHGRKSRISDQAPSAKAFAWFWSKLITGEIPDTLEVWHEGTCGKCGRSLTDPESIARGIGPVCADNGGY